MTAYRFRAKALTPVHVGCGTEIDPLEFVLHENRLFRFSAADVINTLPNDELQRYLELLDKADLKAIQSFFRNHVEPGRVGVVPVDVSKLFMKEYEEKAANPNNQFRVEMMPRNTHTGMAYLPGSGIKGAIRTALVNYFTNLDPATQGMVHHAVSREQDKRKRGRLLEEQALNRRQSQTERDVLRLLHVEDVPLPKGITRIDRAVNWNPAKPGSENIQMWVERLKALADGGEPPQFTVTVHLDTLKMDQERVRGNLGRTVDFETILMACNRFYWGRMAAEGEKFDDSRTDGKSWNALLDAFPKGKTTAGQVVSINPSKAYWCDRHSKRVLLRVGRFSHFESLSVDGLREGYNVQARRPISDMGATRTRCAMENGKPPMPFGWIILTLENTVQPAGGTRI